MLNELGFKIRWMTCRAIQHLPGPIPRLYDIAKHLRDKLDAARGATRALVLAVGRERQGLGFRQRQRTRDAVVAARDEAMRESAEDKARLVVDLKAAQEELELVQRQMLETRSAPAARAGAYTRSLLSST